MGLVNELQESAERDDVVTVLRKAKRLSAKLSREDIKEWLDHEQTGYPDSSKIPDYRVVSVSLCYNTNGYIPAGFGMVKNGIVPLQGFDYNLKIPLHDSIGTISTFIDGAKQGRGIFQPVGDEISASIRRRLHASDPWLLNQITFLAQLNNTEVADIPEQVKNRILDWSCDLESAGVTGDGVSFSEKEKRIASSVIFNISHSSIDQLTNSGTNIRK